MPTWDEVKRKINVKKHGLDFVECWAIWDHFTVTREDKRQDYGEVRLGSVLVSLGQKWR